MLKPVKTLHLEDLAVGDRFVSDTHAIDAAQIVSFAREFDPQPFHLDDAEARGSLFGGLAASGWHTAAITMRLIVASLPIAGGVIGAGAEIAWPQPTRAGDVLHIEAVVTAIAPSRTKPDRGIVRFAIRTINQRGETVQELAPSVVVLRRT